MPKRKNKGSRNISTKTTAASSLPPVTSPTSNSSSSSNRNGYNNSNSNNPSTFEDVMGQYAMSDKEFYKFKAKVDSGIIPKAFQNSLESMVDEVLTESIDGSGTVSVNGIVKEFTITGNKLTSITSPSMQEVDGKKGPVIGNENENEILDSAASVSSIGSGGKKRPRDRNSAFEKQNAADEKKISNLDEQQQQQLSYSFHNRDEGEDNDYSEDEYGEEEEEEDHVIGVCLHCGLEPPPPYSDSCTHDNSVLSNTASGIQCDEMDQCEDCGEVVCGGCGALCSCKFCGCGLCEDCATACGRCGIVLCQRDAKFAVECDTCKMSYCLVCLASGTKDPCVRCGHRTSKRVEQLVHLRLKSIYKAFKQSGAALDNNSKGTAKKGSDIPSLKVGSARENMKAIPMPPGGLPVLEMSGKYHPNGIGASPMNGDVGAVLQVAAAAAAASAAASGKGSRCESSINKDDLFNGLPRGVDASKVMPHLNHDGSISFHPRKEPKKNDSD
eukprot:scaffold8539_cov191-Chaetoceros_neogracile.AAC.2